MFAEFVQDSPVDRNAAVKSVPASFHFFFFFFFFLANSTASWLIAQGDSEDIHTHNVHK